MYIQWRTFKDICKYNMYLQEKGEKKRNGY